MRKALALPLILLAASCGQADQRDPSPTGDVAADSDASSAPGVNPTAAPGVAFNYRYGFRLPAARIEAVQDQHAAACEKLGLDRCRITGMSFERNGDDDVTAQLAFKIDPAAARGFGKQGIDAVTRAEGLLVNANVTGEDVGSEIAVGERSQAQLADELKRVEQQLARPGLGSTERAELQQQAQSLRTNLRAGQATQTERRETLARTPVVFDYRSGDTRGPIAGALVRAGDNFIGAATVLLVVLVTLLPFALAALLGWLLWRWASRRLLGAGRVTPPAASPEG
jgi:hypothetical protein